MNICVYNITAIEDLWMSVSESRKEVVVWPDIWTTVLTVLL